MIWFLYLAWLLSQSMHPSQREEPCQIWGQKGVQNHSIIIQVDNRDNSNYWLNVQSLFRHYSYNDCDCLSQLLHQAYSSVWSYIKLISTNPSHHFTTHSHRPYGVLLFIILTNLFWIERSQTSFQLFIWLQTNKQNVLKKKYWFVLGMENWNDNNANNILHLKRIITILIKRNGASNAAVNTNSHIFSSFFSVDLVMVTPQWW